MLIARQNRILEIARQAGRVMVEELASQFEVTPQTIRKDLNELCDKRLLTRIHGGAILSSGVENVGYDARRMIASDEKEAIALAAAARIPELRLALHQHRHHDGGGRARAASAQRA